MQIVNPLVPQVRALVRSHILLGRTAGATDRRTYRLWVGEEIRSQVYVSLANY